MNNDNLIELEIANVGGAIKFNDNTRKSPSLRR